MGMPLLPWQEYVINDGCKIKDNGEFVSKTNLLIIARQNGKRHLQSFAFLPGYSFGMNNYRLPQLRIVMLLWKHSDQLLK
jgi:hypothetical protein